jgi:alpha,alpha-trehalase
MVPNANKTYLISHSQPPLLTSFIFDVYNAYQLDRRWLEQAMSYAKKEYYAVWMCEKKPHHHQVYQGLSRYYDVNVHHDLAEAESGWDMTTRFGRKCLDYLPVDLNTFLYVYESDFMKASEILQDQEGVVYWRKAAAKRKKAINSLLWNERRGNFSTSIIKNSHKALLPLWHRTQLCGLGWRINLRQKKWLRIFHDLKQKVVLPLPKTQPCN